MSLFTSMTTEGMEEQRDTLGGFSLLESGIYPATIRVAYAGRSQSGAMNITLLADIEGKEYRETVYITNRNGENFFSDKNDGKKKPLPGFTIINDLCQIACDKPLNVIEPETKTLKVYSPELQKEVPTQVPVIMDLLNKKVNLAIVKEKRFKMQNSDKGYVETDEIRESNAIQKVFDFDTKQTVYEIKHGVSETPLFYDKWKEKNDGVVVDKTRKGHSQQTPSVPQKTERKSLFS